MKPWTLIHLQEPLTLQFLTVGNFCRCNLTSIATNTLTLRRRWSMGSSTKWSARFARRRLACDMWIWSFLSLLLTDNRVEGCNSHDATHCSQSLVSAIYSIPIPMESHALYKIIWLSRTSVPCAYMGIKHQHQIYIYMTHKIKCMQPHYA